MIAGPTDSRPRRSADSGKISSTEGEPAPPAGHECEHRSSRRWLGLASILVCVGALAILIPTLGDIGLTWDEPAYRYSQIVSAQWWERLSKARSWEEARPLFDADTLTYYWPYARFGINFHPPLAGQLNLATHALFGGIMKDFPARRMATAIEFALALAIGFHFLARRYGLWVGFLASATLFLTPRVFGQAHLVDTDIPGMFLWVATAIAFWNGLHEPRGRGWRVLVGILLGLAFLEKMAAVTVIVPLMTWLVGGYLPIRFWRKSVRADWIDGLVTSLAMLIPLGLAFLDIQSIQRQLPPPVKIDFFTDRPVATWPGIILAVPLFVWIGRRFLGRFRAKSPIWGAERPALETWTAILAFAPVVGWLGNPGWWRETLARMAHYYVISTNRRGVLPPIQILYAGQGYDYSLPWHNAWVLIGITVPAAILIASIIGLVWAIRRIPKDRLPLYFFVHLATLPALRMLPTPAHDGVRLLLPTFFFLSAFAAWGIVALADRLARSTSLSQPVATSALALLVLGSAGYQSFRIHPYQLSYYNEIIGGPRGAWSRGFELSYWYDAFDDKVLADLNSKLPPNTSIDFLNELTQPMVFQEHQTLGHLRPDLQIGWANTKSFPYVWLLTQDSKATAFTRLLYAMRPWYSSTPAQVDGARIVTVADPVAVSRAWALQLLLDSPDLSPPQPPAAPSWIQKYAPPLARFWGDGLNRLAKPTANPRTLLWARTDPASLRKAAEEIATSKKPLPDTPALRLMQIIEPNYETDAPKSRAERLTILLRIRPEAFVEAAQIVTDHPDEIESIMTRYPYTDPTTIGGYLDRNLEKPSPTG